MTDDRFERMFDRYYSRLAQAVEELYPECSDFQAAEQAWDDGILSDSEYRILLLS